MVKHRPLLSFWVIRPCSLASDCKPIVELITGDIVPAYNEKKRAGGTLPTTINYTGQRLDGSGLVYMNARYYDPLVGMFISPDTIVPDAGVLIDYNRFAYGRANPLKYNDPSGHCVGAFSEFGHEPDCKPAPGEEGRTPTREEVHMALDAVGVVDPTGVVDTANAAMYLTEGQYRDAGLTFLGVIPILGDTAKGAKYADEAVTVVKKVIVIGEGMDDIKIAAKSIDAKWYQAWGKFFGDNFDLGESLRRNERWIRIKIEEGYTIYDIGIDESRNMRSAFYELEQRIIKELDYPTIPMERP